MVFYSLICYSSLDYDRPSTTETQVNTKTIGHVYSFCKENLNLMPKALLNVPLWTILWNLDNAVCFAIKVKTRSL